MVLRAFGITPDDKMSLVLAKNKETALVLTSWKIPRLNMMQACSWRCDPGQRRLSESLSVSLWRSFTSYQPGGLLGYGALDYNSGPNSFYSYGLYTPEAGGFAEQFPGVPAQNVRRKPHCFFGGT